MTISTLVRKDFLKFGVDDTVHAMVNKLKLSGKRSALVFHDNHYIGVVNRRLLLRNSLSVDNASLARCTTKTPIIPYNADLLSTAKLMYVGNLRFLPVEKDGEIQGIITALDLLNELSTSAVMQKLQLSDLKLSKPLPLRKNDKLSTAISSMQKDKMDHIPIFEGKELLGVISLGNLMDYFVYKGKKTSRGNKGVGVASFERVKLSSLPALSFATTTELKTITRDSTLASAIKEMNKHNVRDLVVKEGEKVFGLVTVGDILARLATHQYEANVTLELVGLGKTIASDFRKEQVEKAAFTEGDKLQRKLKQDLHIRLHIKEKKKDGKKHRYIVSLHAECPGMRFNSKAEDWDLLKAVHRCFAAIKKSLC